MANRKKIEASDLRSHIGYHLRVVSNAVSHSFARKLEETGVTVAEWVILREMYSGNETTSPSEVAKLTGLTRGAVSKLIDRLLSKGFVDRTESTLDRRYQDIQLSESAVKLVPKLAKIADDNDEKFFSPLTDPERKSLLKILKRLAEYHQMNASPIE